MVDVLHRLSKAKAFKGFFRGFLLQPGLRALGRDQRGVIIVMFALMLPIFLGFIGLGVEVGYWFQEKRDLQAAADAAAVAGAYENAEGRSSGVGTIATREAVNNGFTGTPTIRSFPFNSQFPNSSTGVYSADADAVSVDLSVSLDRLFSSFFMSGNMTISAHALADVVAGATDACVLALGSANASKSLWVKGSASATMTGCTAATNSTNAAAITVTAPFSVDCAYSAGGVSETALTVTACSAPQSNQPAVADPYANLTEPEDVPISACSAAYSPGDGASDGPFCSMSVTSNQTLTAGTYYIDQGNVSITGGATVTATAGVTIVFFDSNDAGNCGGLTIAGNSDIDITAPNDSSGQPYPGITFYRGPSCNATGELKFAGNNDSAVYGAIYNPSGPIKITGNGDVGGTCMQVISDTVQISGSSTLGSNCASGSGVKQVLAGGIGSLVE